MSTPSHDSSEQNRRARTRRLSIVLFLVAAGFYATFIALSIVHGRH